MKKNAINYETFLKKNVSGPFKGQNLKNADFRAFEDKYADFSKWKPIKVLIEHRELIKNML